MTLEKSDASISLQKIIGKQIFRKKVGVTTVYRENNRDVELYFEKFALKSHFRQFLTRVFLPRKEWTKLESFCRKKECRLHPSPLCCFQSHHHQGEGKRRKGA